MIVGCCARFPGLPRSNRSRIASPVPEFQDQEIETTRHAFAGNWVSAGDAILCVVPRYNIGG